MNWIDQNQNRSEIQAINKIIHADIEEGAVGICKECDCDNNTAKCWRKYFLLKARDKHDKTRDTTISNT